MKPQTTILGGLAIGVLVIIGLGVWRYAHSGQREIQLIAARLIPCPADQIEVLASDESDTAEVHQVRGCG